MTARPSLQEESTPNSCFILKCHRKGWTTVVTKTPLSLWLQLQRSRVLVGRMQVALPDCGVGTGLTVSSPSLLGKCFPSVQFPTIAAWWEPSYFMLPGEKLPYGKILTWINRWCSPDHKTVWKDGLSVSIGYQLHAQEKTVLERSQNSLFPEV